MHAVNRNCCTRVAPRLTENRVPATGYPEPSEPEPSRSNPRNRGYLYPSIVLYGRPRVGHTSIYTAAAVPLDSRLVPLQPTYRPRIENIPINTYQYLAFHAAAPKLQGKQIVYGNPGTRVHLTTPPLKRKKGSK